MKKINLYQKLLFILTPTRYIPINLLPFTYHMKRVENSDFMTVLYLHYTYKNIY